MSERDFEQGLKEYEREFMRAAERGLAQAGMQLMDDAISMVPKVPHDEGTLRGSFSVFVGKDLKVTSEEYAAGDPKAEPNPATSHDVRFEGDVLGAVVAANTPYATWLHEHEDLNFTEEGTGGKYLELPLNQERDEYMQIIADQIRAIGGPPGSTVIGFGR